MASETPPATPPVLHRSLLNRLRYKHLHMLVALGSSLNLHRASIGLAMSQPAATRMLREIEDMFGCQLFERLPRGMRPTALGAQLVRFAEASLNSLDRCAEDLAARRQGGYGYLSIGTIMGAAPDLVMTAVARLKAGNPQLRIRIMGDTSDQVLRLLDQRRIDLAIARRNPSAEGGPYSFEELGNERLLVVVRSGHALARRRKLAWEELLHDWPWILQPSTSPARIALDQLLQRLGLPAPADVIECSSVYSMQQLVQLTDAAMLLSESALKDYLRMGLVKALPLRLDAPLAPFGILARADEALNPEQQKFIDLLHSLGRADDHAQASVVARSQRCKPENRVRHKRIDAI
ncbi:Galactose-binding protein regulator [Delftia tsuruhatensis]|uniref:LysR family transcriptional regulator n=1 Tax=Delftia tsuruhatensis TaxID=180282 RepID=UPI001E7E54D0|nr:LysR family transcriptional regulator [Delftia tsuruhatensis]CAB5684261.1 Galactose-binding protein regulator [Delftia tsuruhatensis]CAC9676018.1 Galactose-binding protein regulator [Delftia tsuruhatensis]